MPFSSTDRKAPVVAERGCFETRLVLSLLNSSPWVKVESRSSFPSGFRSSSLREDVDILDRVESGVVDLMAVERKMGDKSWEKQSNPRHTPGRILWHSFYASKYTALLLLRPLYVVQILCGVSPLIPTVHSRKRHLNPFTLIMPSRDFTTENFDHLQWQ